jgi:hypothetical protein
VSTSRSWLRGPLAERCCRTLRRRRRRGGRVSGAWSRVVLSHCLVLQGITQMMPQAVQDFTQSPVELLNNATPATPLLLHRGRLGRHAHPSCHLARLFNRAHTWLASVDRVIPPQPQERSSQPAHEQESVSHSCLGMLACCQPHIRVSG